MINIDVNDYYARERGSLYSALVQQSPCADDIIFRATEQVACYMNPPYLEHYVHVDDKYADEVCNRAEEVINKMFPPVRCKVEKGELKITEPVKIPAGIGIHRPVLFYIENNDCVDVHIVSEGSDQVEVWKHPVNPWNINAPRLMPSVTIPSGKKAWLCITIIPDNNIPEQVNFKINVNGILQVIPLETELVKTVELKILTRSIDGLTPANIKVETCWGTAQVPEQYRNYMHVLPAGIHPFFYCADFMSSNGEIRVRVPEGKTKIVCTKGFEYRKTLWENQVTCDTEVTMLLVKEWDMFKERWFSSDTHIHWAKTWVYLGDDTPELAVIQRASDCHVISVLTLSQFDGYQEVFTPVHHPMGVIEEHTDDQYIMGMDEEFRNSGIFGHVNILGLKKLITPVSTGWTKTDQSPDYPDNQYFFEKAREQGAIAMCSHGIFQFDMVLIAKGLMDCVDQVSINQYYPVLNCGFRIPTTVGTDANARPMGKMRTYVYVDGDFTYEGWINGIRKGRTFVTNGPLLKFHVNNHMAGDVISMEKADKIRVYGSVFCETPQRVLEVVLNGNVIAKIDNNDNREILEIYEEIYVEESGWIALRSTSGAVVDWMDNAPSAHTSPIYIEIAGERMKPRKHEVEKVIQDLEGYKGFITKKAKFDNLVQQQEVLTHIQEGIELYKKLID